jgi:hypothetical protein
VTAQREVLCPDVLLDDSLGRDTIALRLA